ncbi:MAG: glycosyltransferase family 39 protein [Chloroflexi bacterium]|nr:glycosyltransferase family 39 protein [Chloroflexota bacterium]MCA2002477.1 glycosyltransferase family 39 protein [Chloroflexota bacterium]
MKRTQYAHFFTDNNALLLLALALFLLHMFTNHRYGFHQDEMVAVDNAYNLDWGYVEYPPIAPFLTRISIGLFGLSLVSARMFAALAHSIALVLAGLMARELGAKRPAQVLAAVATAIAPVALVQGATVMYGTFDFLWSVMIACFIIRLLKSENPRWWLAIGATIGLGMMTKYTMAFFAAGIVGGVLLTDARRWLKSPWLWGGVGLSLLVFLPNIIWQIQRDFISLDFLQSIHERDVEIGRAEGYLLEQLVFCANIAAIPLWIAGLYFYFFREDGKRYRMLGWMFIVVFLLYLIGQGRSYYQAPAYPMLIAAGAVVWQGWLEKKSERGARSAARGTWIAVACGAVFAGMLTLPIAPINSFVFNMVGEIHDVFTEQIGWDEMIKEVGDIYAALPDEEKARVGILTGENDEAAALNIYGGQYGLPKAISGSNTFWLRGYGNPLPEILIVVGFERQYIDMFLDQCAVEGTTVNSYGVDNDLADPPEIYLCRKVRYPWNQIWEKMKHYS